MPRFKPSSVSLAGSSLNTLPQQVLDQLLVTGDVKLWFKSNFHQPINLYDASWQEPTSAWSKFWLSLLQPAIVVESRLGTQTYAPYGEPTADYSPLLFAGGIVIGGLSFYGLAAILRS